VEQKYSIGIDPGWKNLGLAIVKEDESGLALVLSQTLNPSSRGLHKAVHDIKSIIQQATSSVAPIPAAIERYVSYNNVLTAESENILMLIGGVSCMLEDAGCPVFLHRAIDWKMELVKLLVKNKGFDNPSSTLDKKFSVAAAKACLDVQGEFNDHHEADAICLASVCLLKDRYAKNRSR